MTPSSPSKAEIILSCDAMGGDHGVDAVIPGAAKAFAGNSRLRFRFYGDTAAIETALKRHPELRPVSTIIHTDEVVAADEKPSLALRRGKATSMRLAIEAVANKEADAVISSGNTGALMAMAKLILRPLPGVHRPAIASILPSQSRWGRTIMLDLGANIQCDAENLIQFAVLGCVYARCAYNIETPTVAILNVGSEDIKGHEYQQEAAGVLSVLNQLPGKFVGFCEGTDISSGRVDVVVTDGFTGNVALKAIEGAGKMFGQAMKSELRKSWLARIGVLFCAAALTHLKGKFDPRIYNGGMFLGLSGLCVKSHGSADATAFANALQSAAALVDHGFVPQVAAQLQDLQQQSAFIDMPTVASA